MKALTIIMLCRGHPEAMVRSCEETLARIELDKTRLVVAVDDDDAPVIEALPRLPAAVVRDVRPREDALGAKYNRCLDHRADVYLPLNDFCWHSTPGFDRRILNAASLFPDGIGAVYNAKNCLAFSPVQAVTHGFVDKLGGKLYPEFFPYWFSDHWLDDIAQMIDRIAFADVTVETWTAKPQTRERRELVFWATFFMAGHVKRRHIAQAIINDPDFQEPAWRKLMLVSRFPLIEYASQYFNQDMINHAPGWGEAQGPGGERYDRLKAQAIGLLNEWAPEVLGVLGARAAA